ALNPSGPRVSPWSVSAYTTPTPRLPVTPSGFSLEPVRNGIMVSWDAIPGAISYSVRGGYFAGSSQASSPTSCSTSSAYETRCLMQATNGTAYFVAMTANSPAGTSASTDELMV